MAMTVHQIADEPQYRRWSVRDDNLSLPLLVSDDLAMVMEFMIEKGQPSFLIFMAGGTARLTIEALDMLIRKT